MAEAPFVQLDFEGESRLFRDFKKVLTAHSLAEVATCLATVDDAIAAGLEAVGFVAYEAAPAFDPAMRVRPPHDDLPLAWFGLTDDSEPGDLTTTGETDFDTWQPSVDAATYRDIFARLQRHIHDGDTYQINYTFPLHSRFRGSVAALYGKLRRAQSASYAAWVHTADWDLLSASPELFFRRRGNRLTTRPMKGTRRRAMTQAEDLLVATELQSNPKDRAENVMIVDLLRNDMGRLATLGSVRPTALFSVERYPTVWQLTSSIEAELPPTTNLSQLLRGLFPCGSVTGAPKIKTMEILAREEQAPRGVYCGAIGHASADAATFNVPIRTLMLHGEQATYSVGSGIVSDSVADDEYDECLAKAQVIAATQRPEFDLLETLLWQPDTDYTLLERHLQRLLDSAAYFGYVAEESTIRQDLKQASEPLAEPHRVRLLVARDGACRTEAFPMAESKLVIRRVRLADQPVNCRDPFLYHKTTHRQVYNDAYAHRGDADDVILYNQHGELTETVFTNLALCLDGRWLTPPVASGLLAGTQRAELVDRGEIAEATLHVGDLQRATGIRLFNSVRGVWDVQLLPAKS